MQHRRSWRVGLLLFLVSLSLVPTEQRLSAAQGKGARQFEVWVTEQSGTAGKLYIYDGKDLTHHASTTVPEVVDLSGAVSAQCMNDTGAAPTRAHIVLFNSTHTVAILAYVASGHVVFMDAATRAPIKCFRMSVGFNSALQAHAAFPAQNDKYVIVANQNGRLLERINTDADANDPPYAGAHDLVHDTAATLDLTSCTTNVGRACQLAGVRPANNVVCPIIVDTSTLTFITLSGGGLLVADTSAGGAPPSILAEYDLDTVHGNGCGGMQASTQANGRMYINSGASTGNPDEADLYSFPADVASYSSDQPNTPAPTLIFSFDGIPPVNDSHGMTLVKKQRFLWVNDRAANEVEVVRTRHDTFINAFSLISEHSTAPAPDLMATDPQGNHVFIALRGPCPLTANDPSVNNAVGATPGVMVVEVKKGGRDGKVKGITPITNPAPAAFDCASRTDDDPPSMPFITERADPHGIAVRLIRGKGLTK